MFSQHSGCALPLVALQYMSLRIEVDVRPLYHLYTIIDTEPSNATFGKRIRPDPLNSEHYLNVFTNVATGNTLSSTNVNLFGNYIFLDKDERPFVIAKVIGYDATQWSKVIFINRGTNHKVQKNASVMNNAGVIGHVIHSSPNSSKVLLITDGRSAVDSLFQETRESGITVGTGENICEMKFVPISAKINLGDKVISSGLGGVFPKGLVVGRVVDIVKQSQELFQDIMVEPSADLSNIEEVIVLLPNQVE